MEEQLILICTMIVVPIICGLGLLIIDLILGNTLEESIIDAKALAKVIFGILFIVAFIYVIKI